MNELKKRDMHGKKSEPTILTGEMNPASPRRRLTTIINSLKHAILLGLAFSTGAFSLPAGEARPTTNKGAPSTLTGKVVYVDRALHALAVEVRGKILQINVLPTVRISRAGKPISLDEVAAGQ